jgi:hypothetical protein
MYNMFDGRASHANIFLEVAMKVTFELDESDLSEDDGRIVLSSLGLPEGTNLQTTLSKIAKCALLEYRKMFIEKGLPTKAAEVMQERLFYLIKGYYKDSLPNEQQISTIFQLTYSSAKTLLRNTISKYRIYLQSEIKETIKKVLKTATEDDGKFRIVVQSETIKDELNLYLTQNAPTLKKMLAEKGSAGIFVCPSDTMTFLRERYGI